MLKGRLVFGRWFKRKKKASIDDRQEDDKDVEAIPTDRPTDAAKEDSVDGAKTWRYLDLPVELRAAICTAVDVRMDYLTLLCADPDVARLIGTNTHRAVEERLRRPDRLVCRQCMEPLCDMACVSTLDVTHDSSIMMVDLDRLDIDHHYKNEVILHHRCGAVVGTITPLGDLQLDVFGGYCALCGPSGMLLDLSDYLYLGTRKTKATGSVINRFIAECCIADPDSIVDAGRVWDTFVRFYGRSNAAVVAADRELRAHLDVKLKALYRPTDDGRAATTIQGGDILRNVLAALRPLLDAMQQGQQQQQQQQQQPYTLDDDGEGSAGEESDDASKIADDASEQSDEPETKDDKRCEISTVYRGFRLRSEPLVLYKMDFFRRIHRSRTKFLFFIN